MVLDKVFAVIVLNTLVLSMMIGSIWKRRKLLITFFLFYGLIQNVQDPLVVPIDRVMFKEAFGFKINGHF